MIPGDEFIYKHKYKFLAVSALSAFMGTLDGSIVNVSLPTMAQVFNVPIDTIAWVVLAYSLSIASSLLMVGRLAARRGFRFTYMMGFGLFGIGSSLCGLSDVFWHVVAARVIQGVGASFMMSAGPALITRAFPPDERGKGMGIMGTVVGVGLMSGPPLGGLIVSTIGWKWIFFLNIPVSIFGYLYAGRTLKDVRPEAPDSRMNYTSGFLQALTVIFLLLFLNRVNSPEWPQSALTSLVIVSLSALSVFLWREFKRPHPLISLDIFKYREFTLAISAMFVSFTCTASGLVLIPFYLEDLLHLDPTHVGLVLVTIPIVAGIVAPISGRISDKIGYRLLTTLGLSITAAGIFWTSTLTQFSTRYDVVLRLIVLGFGMGIFQAPNSTVMMASVPRQMTPIASGLLAVARTLGLACGVAISTAVFAYKKAIFAQTMDEASAFAAAFSWVVIAFGCYQIISIIISAFRKNRPPKVE